MSRTIGFTMDEAATAAETDFSDQLKGKVGAFQLSFRRLLEDDGIDDPVLLAIVEQLRNVLANRQQLQQLLTGQVNGSVAPAALSSSSAASSGPSQQDLDDANERADTAEAQNRTLQKDRKVLEQIVLGLGLTAPADSNTAFAPDTPQRVKDKITERERAASTAAAAVDTVPKAAVVAARDKIKTAWNTGRPAATNHDKFVIGNPRDRSQIDDGVHDLDTLVS